MIRSSWPWKSSWRNSASTASSSSGGRCWSESQQRPLTPNRSDAGQRGDQVAMQDRLHLVEPVYELTMVDRRATWRRSACVVSSATHTDGR